MGAFTTFVKRLFLFALLVSFLKKTRLYKNWLVQDRARRLVLDRKVVEPTYERVVEEFKNNFLEGRERGGQITCTVNGRVVVDCNAGRDSETVFDGLTMVFSCSKVIESLVVAMLVDRGKLDYDAPVAKYWPEFGQKLSPTTTVSQLMRHQAGLEQVHKAMPLKEAQGILNSIEKLERYLLDMMIVDEDVKRGEKHTRYHAITRGFFVDVLTFKVEGKRVRDFIREEIVPRVSQQPVELYLGCPPKAQHRMEECEGAQSLLETAGELLMHKLGLVSTFYHPGPEASEEEVDMHLMDFLAPDEVDLTLKIIQRGMHFKALVFVTDLGFGAHHWANHPEFRSLPLASASCITNARSLALIGADLAQGGSKLLSPEGFRKAIASSGAEWDEMMHKNITYVNCGWSSDRLGKDWCGWAGAGGSVNVFSHKYKASFAYIPTRLEGRVHKSNGLRMLKVFTRILEAQQQLSSKA